MTALFVDTSAFLAVLDAGDGSHERAVDGWSRLIEGMRSGEFSGITHYGVALESSALVQRRMGMEAVRELHDGLLRTLRLEWVDEALHARAVTAMLAAGSRGVSLVDWTSFEMMKARGIRHALAFDSDFEQRGFGLPWA